VFEQFESFVEAAAEPLLVLAVVVMAAFFAVGIAVRLVGAIGRRASWNLVAWTSEASGRALCLLGPVVALQIALPAVEMPAPADDVIDHATRLLLIGSVG
jgi:hypothetical protein